MYYFDKVSYSPSSKSNGNPYQSSLLHGLATRGGRTASLPPFPRPTDQFVCGLSIMRGCDEASLFRPKSALVVNADIAIDLAKLGLRTVEVVISKTVNIRIEDLEKGSRLYQSINNRYPYDTDEMIIGEPDCPECRQKSLRYFEVNCWFERDLREGQILHTYDVGHPNAFDEVMRTETIACEDLLDEIQILNSGGCYLSNTAYEIIAPALDLNFFYVKRLT